MCQGLNSLDHPTFTIGLMTIPYHGETMGVEKTPVSYGFSQLIPVIPMTSEGPSLNANPVLFLSFKIQGA